KGFALLTSLLLLAMLAVFSVGMIYIIQTESLVSGRDLESTQAYYGAAAAMEKMVVDLNALYSSQQVPAAADIQALGGASNVPSLSGVAYTEYSFAVPNTGGVPDVEIRNISAGPNQGLVADITTVTLTVTAKGLGGEVVRMTRDVEVAPIPAFQFGVFSDGDLSYFSNGLIQLRGRVHTNGNLFLAAGETKDLVFHSRITAAKEVIRAELANGLSTAGVGWTRSVKIRTAPNGCEGTMPACRDLLLSEGSKIGGPTSTDNPNWTSLSQSTYNGMILNGDTGAKALNLQFVNSGVRAIELIRRPPAGEDPTSRLSQSRLYNQAQIRVLISDNQAELPGGAGVRLANVAPYLILIPFPPFMVYGLTNTAFAEDGIGTPLIDGYLLVQARRTGGTYADVTLEWLYLGIAQENPNAILKFQSLHDHEPDGSPDHSNTAGNRDDGDKFYPFNLYDTREGEVRDVAGPTDCALGGIMNVIELDVGNLRGWLTGAIGITGTQVESASQNGYLLYFSDRRGMLPNAGGNKVGEYGYEDIINPADSTGAPDGILDPSEDVNQNGVLDTYGAGNLGDGFGAPNGNPTTRIICNDGRTKRVSGARHALKLVNGSLGNLPTKTDGSGGFTAASENPLYVQGNYNANNLGFGDPHAAAAIIADSVTFLSNNWGNWRSFQSPTNPLSRPATSTWYRVVVAAGKNMNWPHPSWTTNHDYGLDGGPHNFVRFLEKWSGQTLYYKGSLVSLYYSEYGSGIYKCCDSVYKPPSRNYSFDTDFVDPAKLPPGTPRLQDVVSMGFRQIFTFD
ncbi:hypothetical protein MYX65_06320, partial [Acidobacteria bacterium AH-259-L09]|nr:hypothetical protein [Acidobacteria bacterium AH-259-L09]